MNLYIIGHTAPLPPPFEFPTFSPRGDVSVSDPLAVVTALRLPELPSTRNQPFRGRFPIASRWGTRPLYWTCSESMPRLVGLPGAILLLPTTRGNMFVFPNGIQTL